ncbi:hypothetical protein [Rugamonas rivuli]|uniref:Uncharacterized protein n=1 Tax=Rugamonas rivuli TaxID=2743358 RepID=A0A843SFE7_9BURK|nr:hypothetical protein [Rugamonas rivuli]MQA19186.1 hypothetical protein [Rugamonas rivuli]
MSADYGQLKDIVGAATSLMAAASAIGVTWLRRAKWMPPEESVPGGTLRVAGLVSAVAIGILFLERQKIGLETMLLIGALAGLFTIMSLTISIYTNTRYSFVYPESSKRGAPLKRTLGGHKLTAEAQHISEERRMEPQALFVNAAYDKNLVWTQSSQALVQTASVLGFIALQASGSIALSAIAIGLSI